MRMHIGLRPWSLQMAWRMKSLRVLVNILSLPTNIAGRNSPG